MKLLNQSLLYLFVPLFVLISAWAVVFYFSMLDEVYDSIDDGLDNSKLLIITKAREDASILNRREFEEGNYAIREMPRPAALRVTDLYQDTLMYMLNEEDLEPVRMLTTAFELDDRYYELKVINSMVEEDDQIENLLWSVLLLYLLLLVSIALINNLALKKLWQPFYRYMGQLKAFRLDHGGPLTGMNTDTEEFLELKRSADALIGHSREVYRNQKRFNENASHELQTPLAVIHNKLELLLEGGRLSEEDAAAVGQVMKTTSQLIRLSQSLLLLSKIENKQFFDNQPVSVNRVVRRVCNELEELLAHRNIDLDYAGGVEIVVEMDPHLAYILVANLIRNAIFHNHAGGRIQLIFASEALTVQNTSAGGELAVDKVFNRFYRESSSRKSSGLGLAMVRAIADLYGFRVAYRYTGEQVFCVRFGGREK
ncbi:sensor histidine kinase [Lewinella sp. IMCC34183]|uniref:sensor histidine kinase n=1 Tax=Lewinella sp. IMCC34183 TaxID=2248762 RepID=UPI000E230876|nr:HAMP domain-containing sensor histidine kinase [Lewinella sp. IMCC34183]